MCECDDRLDSDDFICNISKEELEATMRELRVLSRHTAVSNESSIGEFLLLQEIVDLASSLCFFFFAGVVPRNDCFGQTRTRLQEEARGSEFFSSSSER